MCHFLQIFPLYNDIAILLIHNSKGDL